MLVQIKNVNLSIEKFDDLINNIKSYSSIKIKDTYKLLVNEKQVPELLELKSNLSKKGETIIVTLNL
jgi:hypothetical protein